MDETGEEQERPAQQRRHVGKVTQCRLAQCLGCLLVAGHGRSTGWTVARWESRLEVSLEPQAKAFRLSLEELGAADDLSAGEWPDPIYILERSLAVVMG